MTAIFTIGYEGFSLDEWLQEVASAGFTIVVDVRELPLSRRRGFSRTALSAALRDAGVTYVHSKDLGNPKALRHQLRDGSIAFEEFTRQFENLLDGRGEALADVVHLAANDRVCLLCFEEDPATCHRSLVAERIAQLIPGKAEVRHVRRTDTQVANARNRKDVPSAEQEVRRARVHCWDRFGEPKVRPAAPC